MSLASRKFGEFELDCARYELRRNGRALKIERIPMELLILLAEKDGNIVTRQEIIDRLWGKDVFVDTEHGINTAIRKVRSALQEDADLPHFVQTVPGKGYRFVAELKDTDGNGKAGSHSRGDCSRPICTPNAGELAAGCDCRACSPRCRPSIGAESSIASTQDLSHHPTHQRRPRERPANRDRWPASLLF